MLKVINGEIYNDKEICFIGVARGDDEDDKTGNKPFKVIFNNGKKRYIDAKTFECFKDYANKLEKIEDFLMRNTSFLEEG